ncbi:hypothetical protein N0V85_005905 [Neurospora sp. IMI 360204]|nr:hypothetical protein N0V85_005905 [Neurospora sp. IMI 360204]
MSSSDAAIDIQQSLVQDDQPVDNVDSVLIVPVVLGPPSDALGQVRREQPLAAARVDSCSLHLSRRHPL